MIENLYKQAKDVMQHAYAPYSNYAVGAALFDGTEIFTGCNVENSSYPVCKCAESNAIGNMVAKKGYQKVQKICICATSEPVLPCGACLQILNEFMNNDGMIITSTPKSILKTYTLHDLLPYNFTLS